MLSITKDLDIGNGIKASNYPHLVCLMPENVEESYQRIIAGASPIAITNGKYSLMLTNTFKLIDSDGNVLDFAGDVIRQIGGKYFIIFDNGFYKIIDADGQLIKDNLNNIDYVGDVISFHDKKEKADFVVTPDAIVTKPLDTAEIVAAIPDGTYFVLDKVYNHYVAYDSYGNELQRGADLNSLVTLYRDKLNKDNSESSKEKSNELFSKVILKEFQKYPELCNYDASSLLDMLAKAASLDVDFYINLKKAEVCQTKFKPLLKISDSERSIWVPDSSEELKVMDDFCLTRRKGNE